MPGRLKAPKGFSLVEIMVTVGILAAALGGMMFLFSNSVVLNEDSRNTTLALSHIQFVLEDIRNTPYAMDLARIKIGDWAWDQAKISGHGLTPLHEERITVEALGTDPLTVTVIATWKNTYRRARTLAISTIMGGA